MSYRDELKKMGPFWADLATGPDGELVWAVQCSSPPTDRHNLCFMPGSTGADEIAAQTISKALNAASK